MNNEALIQKIYEICLPIAKELNDEIYHIEYIKENGDYYLRVYIDKPEGIKINDCEDFSRRVNTLLDENDFIKEQYYFEVSSPGLNRNLYNVEHYKRYIGKEICVHLKNAINNKKTYKGILKNVNEDTIDITEENDVNIPFDKIKSANLEGEI